MREAAVMLIVKDGKVLSISRRHDRTKFGLPGGKKEDNETTEEAAIRETLEETGVKVNKCVHIFRRDEPRHNPDGQDFHCHCYYALDWEGEPSNSEEGEVAWLSEEELTGDKGAFADYNRRTLIVFRTLFPNVKLLPNAVIGEE